MQKMPAETNGKEKTKTSTEVFEEGYEEFINKSSSAYENKGPKEKKNELNSTKKVNMKKKDTLEPL